MTALVTGATGFIGAAVARSLAARGEPVRVLCRPGGDRRNLDGLPVEVAEGDLARPGTFPALLEDVRVLYHVAADYRLWTPDPAAMYRINVDGTRALLEAAAAARVPRIVYTSSVATLGLTADGSPADETTPAALEDMAGHYKRSKYLAEEAVRELVRARAVPAVIVNPSAPVGPGDVKPTPTGQTLLDAARGRMPAYVDTGLNVVHVDDVAAGHLAAAERGTPGRRYILGGTDMTLEEILAVVGELTGRPPPRLKLPHGLVIAVAHGSEALARLTGRPPRVPLEGARLARKRMFFSSARAAAELGYRARPARTAIADAIDWFRAAGYLDV